MVAPNATFSGTNVFRLGSETSSLIRTLSAFWDGGGSAISTAKNIYMFVPVALKIEGWALFCDVSATLTVDIWQVLLANAPPTVSNSICNSNYLSITAGTQNSLYTSSGTALGFSTSLNMQGTPIIPAGSAIVFNLLTNNNATFLAAHLLCRSGS